MNINGCASNLKKLFRRLCSFNYPGSIMGKSRENTKNERSIMTCFTKGLERFTSAGDRVSTQKGHESTLWITFDIVLIESSTFQHVFADRPRHTPIIHPSRPPLDIVHYLNFMSKLFDHIFNQKESKKRAKTKGLL